MPVRLLIDGYNLIGAYGLMRNKDLEKERNSLIKKLSEYKKIKHHDIIIIFDGLRSRNIFDGHDRVRGVSIIYSRTGESADDLIKKIVKSEGTGEGFVVVTSDREIKDFCSSYNATVISSSEFKNRLEMAGFLCDKDSNGEEENDSVATLSTKKRGNPKRLSKTERRRMSKLKKL